MTSRRTSLLLCIIGFLVFPPVVLGYGISPVQSRSIVLEKEEVILSEKATRYLFSQESDRVNIWIFFTDKGVFNQADYSRAATKMEIGAHAAQRRSKVGVEGVVFADLPIRQKYVERIIQLGATHRRSSRWLNAASFEVSKDVLESVAALPFVNKIQPVAKFKRIDVPPEGPEPQMPEFEKTQSDALNYGLSYTQMQMINAPAMHDMGYNGEGVIVAMLDTGYRKSHVAFQQAYSEGRVLAEYDFIFNDDETQNESEDNAAQHNHGTYTLSALGGFAPGNLIGPAYGASFLLAKTEDIRSEYPAEEDNWMAAMEWADSLGADVISSSLGYSDWYFFFEFDGQTAVTTIAANIATSLGIIVCNSMGNEGTFGFRTLIAPADAFEILACGAVGANESIASFSSKGPTSDGRLKPEVCAMGVNTRSANPLGDFGYTYVSGTSLSTPLVGGAAAVLRQAHPTYTPQQIRKAFMLTADNADTPDSTYGWGIIDMVAAFNWGANFRADVTHGYAGLTVQFTDSSIASAGNHQWYFGDGESSNDVNPVHTYAGGGMFDVTLVIDSDEGQLQRTKSEFISVFADTMTIVSDSGYAGHTLEISVFLSNTQRLNSITLPVRYSGFPVTSLDSVGPGSRTAFIASVNEVHRNDLQQELAIQMTTPSFSPLEPGPGEVAKLYFTLDSFALSGDSGWVEIAEVSGISALLSNDSFTYVPDVSGGDIFTRTVIRGDADNSGDINLLDVLLLIGHIYMDGPGPITIENGDAVADQELNLLDILELIEFLYG
ncbi:MAG: S8 family serine peptidase [Candidatus Zixiibacteriota bacterium]|nr:MAG: S8 family serine peptidase [candidate division Zixibacteria bacterium]